MLDLRMILILGSQLDLCELVKALHVHLLHDFRTRVLLPVVGLIEATGI